MNTNLTYTSAPFPGIEALSCSNDFHFESHIHNGYVLWLNSAGGEHYTLCGRSEILQPGSISIIEPGVVHSNHPCEDSVRHLRSLYLENRFFLHLEKIFTRSSTGNYLLPTTSYDSPPLWQKLLALHESIICGWDRLEIEQCLVAFFSGIDDNLSLGKVAETNNLGSDKRLEKVVEYMQANLSEQVSLEDLAEVANCTSYHIIRLFKRQKGMSPHAYLIQIRLEEARRCIDKGSGIAEAALCAGFADQSHLTRKFKNRYGLTPGKYILQKKT